MLRAVLRPVPLLAAAASLLGAAALLAHLTLAGLAGGLQAEAEARRALLDRIHALALERADRTAGFHRAAAQALAEGRPIREAAAREIGDGARALVRRGRDLGTTLAGSGPVLPPEERDRVARAVDLVLERVDGAARAADALAGADDPDAALTGADAAVRALSRTLEEAERELEGLALRARARAGTGVRRAHGTGAGLAGLAVLLAAGAFAFRARGAGRG